MYNYEVKVKVLQEDDESGKIKTTTQTYLITNAYSIPEANDRTIHYMKKMNYNSYEIVGVSLSKILYVIEGEKK
jgi:hypothetical protein